MSEPNMVTEPDVATQRSRQPKLESGRTRALRNDVAQRTPVHATTASRSAAMKDARRGLLLAADGPVKTIRLFGALALVFVIGCGGTAQTSDGAAGTTGGGGTGGALPPAMGTPG